MATAATTNPSTGSISKLSCMKTAFIGGAIEQRANEQDIGQQLSCVSP